MANYQILKLKSYVKSLVIGLLAVFFGGSVLYPILMEMVTKYDAASKYAYICGIIACLLLILAGVRFIRNAAGFEKQAFGKLTKDERKSFYQELDDEQTLFFDRYLFISRHYILLCTHTRGAAVKLLQMEDLIACYGHPSYAGDEPIQYDLILYDRDFHSYSCRVKGKKSGMMEDACKAICSRAPWVFSDYYEEFAEGIRHRSQRKSMLRIIEHRRKDMEVSEDEIESVTLTAADVIRSYNEKKSAGLRETIDKTIPDVQILKKRNSD